MFVVDELRQDVDVRGGLFLVRDRERVEDLRDRAGTDLRELLARLLRFRVRRSGDSAELRDQPLSFEVREETHPVVPAGQGAPDRLFELGPRENGTDVRIACCKRL